MTVIALGLVVGCYHSNFEANVPCAADLSCPGTQVCDTTHVPPVCVGELGSGGDQTDGGNVPSDGALTACGICPAEQPVCDATSTTCRGCYRDADCSSQVCSESTGLCIADAETLYVKNGGNDANPCTHDAPCAHVSRAIALLDGTHHVVKIYDGDYGDSFVANATFLLSGEGNANANAYISYKGIDNHDHLFELDGGTALVEGVSFDGGSTETVRVQGGAALTLFNTEILHSPVGSVDVAGSTVTLYNVAIHDGSGAEAAINLANSQLTMLRTVMYSLTGGCVKAAGSKYDIENSFIVTCGGPALEQLGPTPDPAVFTFNTVVNNATGLTCTAPITVSNSIFAYNGAAPQVSSCAATTYSLFSDSVVPGTGNIAGDPSFVANDDDHITFGSPARDKANPASTQTEDFDGEHRPHGSGYDIGADEHY
ncbi:MAG: choice-of-anchor Q domain-containing protein [Kofleriaceae bacterium]